MSAVDGPGAGLLAALLLAAGCDAFDFGQVMGSAAPAAPASAAPAAAPRPDAGARRAPRLVVAIGGDLSPANAPSGATVAALAPVLSAAAIRIASLGSPITAKVVPRRSAAPAAAAELGRSGLGLLSLGNLTLDLGPAALLETLDHLEASGIEPVGAGRAPEDATRTTRLDVEGWSVAVVAGGGRPSPLLASRDPLRLERAIRDARPKHHLVLVTLVTSATAGESSPPEDRSLAAALAAAGADAIVFHGAKVPRGVASVEGRPVLYGLGSLLGAGDPAEPWTARGWIARLGFTTSGGREVDLCPYVAGAGGPRLLTEPGRASEEGVFVRSIKRLREPLGGGPVSEPALHSCVRLGG